MTGSPARAAVTREPVCGAAHGEMGEDRMNRIYRMAEGEGGQVPPGTAGNSPVFQDWVGRV